MERKIHRFEGVGLISAISSAVVGCVLVSENRPNYWDPLSRCYITSSDCPRRKGGFARFMVPYREGTELLKYEHVIFILPP